VRNTNNKTGRIVRSKLFARFCSVSASGSAFRLAFNVGVAGRTARLYCSPTAGRTARFIEKDKCRSAAVTEIPAGTLIGPAIGTGYDFLLSRRKPDILIFHIETVHIGNPLGSTENYLSSIINKILDPAG
jgi:hypothetical protein